MAPLLDKLAKAYGFKFGQHRGAGEVSWYLLLLIQLAAVVVVSAMAIRFVIAVIRYGLGLIGR